MVVDDPKTTTGSVDKKVSRSAVAVTTATDRSVLGDARPENGQNHHDSSAATSSMARRRSSQANSPTNVIPVATRNSLRIRSRTRKQGGQEEDYDSHDNVEDEGVQPNSSVGAETPLAAHNKKELIPPVDPATAKKASPASPAGVLKISQEALLLPGPKRREQVTSEEKQQQITVNHFSDMDVVCGRGNHIARLPGNRRFRRIVHPFRASYMGTKDPGEKRMILLEAFDAVIDGGHNFYEVVRWAHDVKSKKASAETVGKGQQLNNGDEEYVNDGEDRGVFRTVPLSRALEKVAQALREPKWIPPPSDDPEPQVTISRADKSKNVDSVKPAAEKPQFKHILLLSFQQDEEEEDKQQATRPEETRPKEDHPALPFPIIVPERQQPQPTGEKASSKKKRPARRESVSKLASVSYERSKRAKLPVVDEDVMAKIAALPDIFPELSPNDVLFGRGHNINTHPGNILFRKVVHQNKPAYVKLGLNEKKPLALEIYLEFGGRFVEIDPGSKPARKGKNKTRPQPVFRRVSMERCIEKICQALREKHRYIPKGASKVPAGDTVEQVAGASKTEAVESGQPTEAENTGGDGEPAIEVPQAENHEAISPPLVTRTAKRKKQQETRRLNPGAQISIYWPLDSVFYEAEVEECKEVRVNGEDEDSDSGNGVMLHKIRYQLDGDQEWIDLSEHKYIVRKDASSPPLSVPEQSSRPASPSLTASKQVVSIMRGGRAKRHKARRSFFWKDEGPSNPNGVADALA